MKLGRFLFLYKNYLCGQFHRVLKIFDKNSVELTWNDPITIPFRSPASADQSRHPSRRKPSPGVLFLEEPRHAGEQSGDVATPFQQQRWGSPVARWPQSREYAPAADADTQPARCVPGHKPGGQGHSR